MPALDRDHQIVKNALVKDGWTITHDPLTVPWKDTKLYVELCAEKIIGAERDNIKIAVDIKMFTGPSEVTDLHQATGQYVVYKKLLKRTEPDRHMVLAVPQDVLRSLFRDDLGELLVEDGTMRVVGYDPIQEELRQWLPQIEIESNFERSRAVLSRQRIANPFCFRPRTRSISTY